MSFKIIADGPYMEPQKCRLSGVIKTANSVAIAVKLTDNAEFPFAKCVIKFEILPPGQAATMNIPKAILGIGSINQTNKNVTAGNSKN